MTDPERRVAAIVGNPNCGKTTLFNLLTGGNQSVGNWPGVTVEKKAGAYTHKGARYDLVDLPGVYLIGSVGRGSEDERIARDFILSGEASLIVNILDAANLEPNLYSTAQLLEMGVPLVLVLNMADKAKANGEVIDASALEKFLGCPVVSMVARRGIGRDASSPSIRSQPTPAIQPPRGTG